MKQLPEDEISRDYLYFSFTSYLATLKPTSGHFQKGQPH